MRIILASASPRRRELLQQIGWEFEIKVSRVEEKITKTQPWEVVEELSAQKAENVFDEILGEGGCQEDILVIGADTVVACENRILGKPVDHEDARSMLRMLQGRSHHVYTGVTLCYYRAACPAGTQTVSFHEQTEVFFYPMSEAQIAEYAASSEPMDKAGSYAIQGLCARYIRGIRGDYANVVGLPVGRLYQEVQRLIKGGGSAVQKRAVIFDLDGTLSDSIASIKYCADRAVEPLGMGPFTVEQYCYFIGDGAANLIKRCLVAGGDPELVHFEEAFSRYKEIFREHCMYEVKPYDGIPELLAELKRRDIRIAVLSNKPHAETVRVVEELFGRGYFDAIQGQKPDVAIKPSPEGVRQILERLGLTAEELLYLGDTGTDMRTGKAAGAFTVGALWGFRERKELEEHHADAVIGHPLELLSYLS